jgi:hypothetical protein
MMMFKQGDPVWVKSHRKDVPRIVKEVTRDAVVCTTLDGQDPYPYPHDALELVTRDPSREVKPKTARRIPYGFGWR